MKPVRHWLEAFKIIIVLLPLWFLLVSVAGCAFMDSSRSERFQVVPVSSREVAALSANDIVRIMRRAGFSDEQILELGTRLRNALLLSGAVEIKRGKIVEAIFAINGDNVFITTRLRGNFIYNLEKESWVGLEVVTSRPENRGPSQTLTDGRYPLNSPALHNRLSQGGNTRQR